MALSRLSEKLYKAVEECVKALAELQGIAGYREGCGEGGEDRVASEVHKKIVKNVKIKRG